VALSKCNEKKTYVLYRIHLRSGGTGLGLLSSGDCWIDLLAILPADTGGRSTVASALTGSDTDDMRVDSAGDTVRNFDVKLGEGVFIIYGGGAQITNSSTLDHVTDSEALDGLVLGHTSGAVTASHKLDMATTRLVSAAISSFCRLVFCRSNRMGVKQRFRRQRLEDRKRRFDKTYIEKWMRHRERERIEDGQSVLFIELKVNPMRIHDFQR